MPQVNFGDEMNLEASDDKNPQMTNDLYTRPMYKVPHNANSELLPVTKNMAKTM